MGPRREEKQQSKAELLADSRSPPAPWSASVLRPRLWLQALIRSAAVVPLRADGPEWGPSALSLSNVADLSVNIASFLREDEALCGSK